MIAFILSPIGRWLAAGVLALGLAGGAYVKGRIDGERLALSDVTQKNREAVTNADEARNRVDDCHRSGGMWNRETGKCERGVQSVP